MHEFRSEGEKQNCEAYISQGFGNSGLRKNMSALEEKHRERERDKEKERQKEKAGCRDR